MNQKEREQEVIELYTSGKNCTFIAKLIKIERKSVYRILDRNHISLRLQEKKKCLLCPNLILSEMERNKNLCGTCSTNIRRYRIKKKAVDYKGNKCIRCDWSGDISGFDFHHSDPTQKEFELSGKVIAGMKWERVKLELDKCELLCSLCHRLEHSNYKDHLFLEIANKIE